jgi:hypothetical protein
MNPWSSDYARSLTKDQWVGIIETRFLEINREIESFALAEPMRSTLVRHSLEPFTENELCEWNFHNVRVSGGISTLAVTAYFWQTAYDPTGQIEVEPIWPDEDERSYSITVQAVLHINNEGILSSEVVNVFRGPDALGTDEEYNNEDNLLSMR